VPILAILLVVCSAKNSVVFCTKLATPEIPTYDEQEGKRLKKDDLPNLLCQAHTTDFCLYSESHRKKGRSRVDTCL